MRASPPAHALPVFGLDLECRGNAFGLVHSLCCSAWCGVEVVAAGCRSAATSCVCRHWLVAKHVCPCRYGFEKPSAIQQKGIVPFGKGLDVIQQAQSGTGKTATFCAGILQNLDYGLVECQALVLAPTRELAQQIEKVMRALGDYLQVCTACSVVLLRLLWESRCFDRKQARPGGCPHCGSLEFPG